MHPVSSALRAEVWAYLQQLHSWQLAQLPLIVASQHFKQPLKSFLLQLRLTTFESTGRQRVCLLMNAAAVSCQLDALRLSHLASIKLIVPLMPQRQDVDGVSAFYFIKRDIARVSPRDHDFSHESAGPCFAKDKR